MAILMSAWNFSSITEPYNFLLWYSSRGLISHNVQHPLTQAEIPSEISSFNS